MTAPTMTTEDYMFDLDLLVVPVEEGKDSLPRAGVQGGDIQGRGRDHLRTLVEDCRVYTYITCRRCL